MKTAPPSNTTKQVAKASIKQTGKASGNGKIKRNGSDRFAKHVEFRCPCKIEITQASEMKTAGLIP